VVPISINNSWKFVKYGFFPFGLGNRIIFTLHEPIPVKDYLFEELMGRIESTIKNRINEVKI
jgi:1-acyl-sn-glycerol-3-phosphate acyltransferase